MISESGLWWLVRIAIIISLNVNLWLDYAGDYRNENTEMKI